MLKSLYFLTILAISSMAAWFALPAVAAADDDYAGTLSREATRNPMVSVSIGTAQLSPRLSHEGFLAVQDDPADVRAARLGIITPYGKNALVQELRAYYPESYRLFRGLDRGKVQVLVDEFENTGDVVKVLGRMDQMVEN